MRNIVEEYCVYKFDELPEETQEKVLDKLFDINVHDDWYEFVYDDAAGIGFNIEEFDIDRGCKCDGVIAGDGREMAALIMEHHGGKCGTYVLAVAFKEQLDMLDMAEKLRESCNDEIDEYEYECDYEEKVDELDLEFFSDIKNEYLKILRQEYEYATSKEAIIETINANEYEFTEEGEIHHG